MGIVPQGDPIDGALRGLKEVAAIGSNGKSFAKKPIAKVRVQGSKCNGVADASCSGAKGSLALEVRGDCGRR